MRSQLDEKIDGRGKGRARAKAKPPKGGKALHRLLTYLVERDPALVNEVLPVELPASQMKVGPARGASRARSARSARSSRAVRAPRTLPASRSFAAALTRAAAKVASRRKRRKPGRAKRVRSMVALAAPLTATGWTEIGPLHIPKADYGTRVSM